MQVSISDAEAKKRFKKFDTNGDKVLSRSEFKQVRIEHKKLCAFLSDISRSVLQDVPILSKRRNFSTVCKLRAKEAQFYGC